MPVKPVISPRRAFAYNPLTSRFSHSSRGVDTQISRNEPGPPAASTVPRTHWRVASYGAIGAHTASPPCFVTSAATQPMRRMLTSRSSFENPSPFDRCVRTTSPSSSVIEREPASRSTTARATVDLPEPQKPVKNNVRPSPGGCGTVVVTSTSGPDEYAAAIASAREDASSGSTGTATTWPPAFVAAAAQAGAHDGARASSGRTPPIGNSTSAPAGSLVAGSVDPAGTTTGRSLRTASG